MLPERINRIKYLAMLGYCIIIGYAAALVMIKSSNLMIKALSVTILILVAISTTLLKIKRLHDINLSGWYIFICFVPIIGMCFDISLFITSGSEVENKYSSVPEKASKLECIVACIALPVLLLSYFAALYIYIN